jgi:ATP-dependent Clp protease ATP-binding subunit ClpB
VTGPVTEATQSPAWLRELATSLSINTQIVLYGNIRDRYLYPTPNGIALADLVSCLTATLRDVGYPFLAVADPIDGLRAEPDDTDALAAAEAVLGHGRLGRPVDLPTLRSILPLVVAPAPDREGQLPAAAIAIDYASRLVRDPSNLDEQGQRFFASCEKLSHQAPPRWYDDGVLRYNPIVWILDAERDIPDWLTTGSDAIRKIAIPMPHFGDRLAAASKLVTDLSPPGLAPDAVAAAANRFAEQTHGVSVRGMIEIARLARGLGDVVQRLDDAVRCYRVGVLDNPWRHPSLAERLRQGPERIGRRVRGQPVAVQRSVDILIRSVMGLSGAQASEHGSKPRGVLFFAGPTGVGKTELAKALTELVFGDEQAYIRFDMSEFAAEHAAERLIGAPPGYVGYGTGGELTNAVRERPFSLVLFDEIEKAHPRILDKFLQVLDDGRLTDGSGSTVYFSESVLVFTSNLGMTVVDETGRRVANTSADLPREKLEQRVMDAIRAYFTEQLNRAELLNRLGDNIVVFNYIDPGSAAEIFDLQVRRILARVRKEQGVEVTITDPVRAALLAEATADLSFGGRGIGSALESTFVNPLARALFAYGPGLPPRLSVVALSEVDGSRAVTLA